MGCLFKRGKIYYARWVDHTGEQVKRSTRTTDKASARRMLNKWEQEANDIRAGLIDPVQLAMAEHRRRPVSEHLEAWLADRGIQIQANTLAEYRRHLGRFLGAFGGEEGDAVALHEPAQTLADCTPERMRSFMRWRVADCGASNADANRAYQAVHAWMQWLDDTRRVELNPMRGVKKLDETRRSNRRRIRREYTPEELDMLFRVGRKVDAEWKPVADGRAHSDEPRRAAQYMVGYYMAFRRSDLRSLTWDHIKLGKPGEGGTIEMERKNGRMSVLPVVARLEPVLRELLPAMVLPAAMRGARVFPRVVSMAELRADMRRGRAWHIRAGTTRAERRRRRRGSFLQDDGYGVLDLHSLRHARGTHLAMTNLPPKVLQDMMDHADIRTTMKFYAHTRAGSMADLINRHDVETIQAMLDERDSAAGGA